MADEQLIKPRELPVATDVFEDDAIMTDNGVQVGKATPVQLVDAGAPVPSQAEAIAGVNNTMRMTPLMTKAVLDNVTAPSVERAKAWAEAAGNPDPGAPGSKSAKTWAGTAAAAADRAEAFGWRNKASVADLQADISLTESNTPVGSVVSTPEGYFRRVASGGDVVNAIELEFEALTYRDSISTSQIGMPTNASHDCLVEITKLLNDFSHVIIDPNGGRVAMLSGTVTIPQGKTLEQAGVKLKLFDTCGNNVTRVVRLGGDKARLIGRGEIDGSVTARIDGGYLTTGFTWGAEILNSSNCMIDVASFSDLGMYKPDLAFETDGGPVLINHTDAATKSTTGNVVMPYSVNGEKHGFMGRIRTDFNGKGEGDLIGYCEFNTFYGPITGNGGSKNVFEFVGPHCRFNKVSGVSAYDPSGATGFDCDFGAYGNTYEDCSIVLSDGWVNNYAFVCFSQSISDLGDGKPKFTRNNKFLNPSQMGGVITGNEIFSLCGDLRGATGGLWDGLRSVGLRKGAGSGFRTIYRTNPSVSSVDGVSIINPQVDSVDRIVHAVGSVAIGSINISGGNVKYDGTGTSISNSVDSLTINGGTWTGVNPLVSEGNVRVSRIIDNVFAGQTETTLRPPLGRDKAFIWSGNVFLCGTDSGSPVSYSSSGCQILEGDANVYTRRIPASAVSGNAGQVLASGRGLVLSNTVSNVSRSSVSRATSYRNAVPNAGSWDMGSQVIDVDTAAGSPWGWLCVQGGTFGTLSGVTGNISASSNLLSVSSASGISAGMYVSISGAGAAGGALVSRVMSVSGLTVTILDSASATVSGAAISYSAPVFKAYASIQA